jgi:hypothetical protein
MAGSPKTSNAIWLVMQHYCFKPKYGAQYQVAKCSFDTVKNTKFKVRPFSLLFEMLLLPSFVFCLVICEVCGAEKSTFG